MGFFLLNGDWPLSAVSKRPAMEVTFEYMEKGAVLMQREVSGDWSPSVLSACPL